MESNIVLLHDRTKFWLDITRTPRFKASMIDNAINIAIDGIVKNRFIPNSQQTKKGAIELTGFQRTKQIRDELKPLVKSKLITTGFADNILLNANGDFPADYSYYTLFELTIGGKKVYPTEITQEELRLLLDDPYIRPFIGEYDKTYFMETNDGFQFYIGNNTITSIKLYYLSRQTRVFFGFEKPLSDIPNPTPIIISQESCRIGSTDYKLGDDKDNNGNILVRPVSITAGEMPILAVMGSISSEMPEMLFDEIAKNAAEVLLFIVDKTMTQAQQ